MSGTDSYLLDFFRTKHSDSSVPKAALDAIAANWSLWIPAMAITSAIIPLKYQVLFGHVVALLWTVYFSYISPAQPEEKQVPAESNNNAGSSSTS